MTTNKFIPIEKFTEKLHKIASACNVKLDDEYENSFVEFYKNFMENYTPTQLQNLLSNVIPGFINGNIRSDMIQRYDKIFSIGSKVTLEKMILRYGDSIGLEKWKTYCELQSKTNTFEYKNKKYGMSKEEFEIYNKSRAVTLENCTRRHGETAGKKIFEDYCLAQRTAGITLEYFISKYGEEIGNKEYNRVCSEKSITPLNMIRKYGEVEGLQKYEKIINSIKPYYSKISQELFWKIDKILDFNPSDKMSYFASKNKEYSVWSVEKNGVYFYDYVVPELNLCIEYNGDIYHANPIKYFPDEVPGFRGNKLTSKQIWEKDKCKIDFILHERGYSSIIVWDSDYRKNSDETIEKIMEYINEIRNNK